MTGKLKCEQMPMLKEMEIVKVQKCSLTFIEKNNDLVEWIHKVHVFVAVFLNFQYQCKFGAIASGERLKELLIIFEMT